MKLALCLVTLALTLLVGEVALRLVVKPAPNIILGALQDQLHKVHLDTFSSVIVNDPDLFWRLGPNKSLPTNLPHIRGLVSNAAGLREDHEILQEKLVGELRILCVGDSCTFGFGLLHHESYVEAAERILKERFPGVRIECINAGVPGYTFEQGWRAIEQSGLAYEPDVIITSFGWNDSKSWSTRSDLQTFEHQRRATPPGVLARSELARQVWRRVADATDPPTSDKPVYRVSPDEYRALVLRVRDLCRERGIRYIPLVWPVLKNFAAEPGEPRPFTPYQTVIQELAGEELAADGYIDGLRAIDVAQMAGAPLPRLFIDGCHTTALANESIGLLVADKLSPWLAAKTHPSGSGTSVPAP